MPDTIMAALSGEEILLSNSLAKVATSCVVIRSPNANAHAIVSLSRISSVQRVKTSIPGFLVIAAGLFLIAAAAHFSKDGGSSDLPIALLGLAFVVAYLGSRRASVAFTLGSEKLQTVTGSLAEAAAVVRAVREARPRLEQQAPDEEQAIAS